MRKIALLGVAILMLYACGDESAGAGRVQPFRVSDPPLDTTATIVFIGDSITQQMPVRKYIPSAQNVGVSGNETLQMLARFDADVLARNPQVVVILGGTNDIRNHAQVDTGALFAMVQKTLAANVRVIIGTLPPAESLGTDAATKRPLFAVFNGQVKDGATGLGYHVVDYHSVMVLPDGSIDRRLFLDDLHPNEFGYNAMWSVLRPVLQADLR